MYILYIYIYRERYNNIYTHTYIHILFTILDLCVSSLRRDHTNLLRIVPMLTDDPRGGSNLFCC